MSRWEETWATWAAFEARVRRPRPPPPPPPRRPDLRTTFTDKTPERIIKAVLAGKTVSQIIKMPGMPRCEAFYRMLERNEDFRKRYKQARFIVQTDKVLSGLDELKRTER